MRITFLTMLLTFSVSTSIARAQEDHSQHQATPSAPASAPQPTTPPANPAASQPATPASADPHAGHGGANPAASNDGPWSYKGRKNPEPYTKNRWDMVPGEGNSATFIAADKLSKEQRCAALKRQDVQALDRATRAQCGITTRSP